MLKLNTLIESEYTLSVTEQRLLHLLCKKIRSAFMKMNIKPSEIKDAYANDTFEICRVYVIDYRKQFSIKGNNVYKLFAEAAERLNNTKIKYTEEDGETKEIKLGGFKYRKEERCVDARLNPELLLTFLSLKERYGKYKYFATKNFKRTSRFRLYDLAKEIAYGKGCRKFSINELKTRCGVEEDSYTDIYEFKRNVLKSSTKEIEKFTDISITLEDEVPLKKIIGFTLKASVVNKDINIEKDLISELTQEELDRINIITRLNLTFKEAEKLVTIIILAITENDLDVAFYDYLKELRSSGIIFTLVKSR